MLKQRFDHISVDIKHSTTLDSSNTTIDIILKESIITKKNIQLIVIVVIINILHQII
jgi:hypothetical protein